MAGFTELARQAAANGDEVHFITTGVHPLAGVVNSTQIPRWKYWVLFFARDRRKPAFKIKQSMILRPVLKAKWQSKLRAKLKSYLSNVQFEHDVRVIFESTDAVGVLPEIRKQYPSFRYIYRPSDPFFYKLPGSDMESLERDVLTFFDAIFPVNAKHKRKFEELLKSSSKEIIIRLLGNGVHRALLREARIPSAEHRKTVAYVGNAPIDRLLVRRCATALPDVDFHIVCPKYKKKKELENLIYVGGLPHDKAMRYTVGCDVFFTPYDIEKDWLRDVSGKFFQAFLAEKPIVAVGVQGDDYDGLDFCRDGSDFVYKLALAVDQAPRKVKHRQAAGVLDWSQVFRNFEEYMQLLKS
ncbi:hypothetical protein V6X51_09785 [Spiribacter sp. 196]|uniref:Glucuronosyltransferase GumK N-terminal domain-containing protein n=1 Tax=Spiribacter roseus TaxID=1855875 RepID=A0ABV3RZU6_9GAMM